MKVSDCLGSKLLVILLADFLLDPGVGKSLHGGQTLGNVVFHKLRDQVLGRIINAGPNLTMERPLALLDLLNDLVVAAIEGRGAAKHDVKDNADAPHVALLCVFSVEDLWGNVVWRAVHLVHNMRFLVVMVGRTKVDHFYVASIVDVD